MFKKIWMKLSDVIFNVVGRVISNYTIIAVWCDCRGCRIRNFLSTKYNFKLWRQLDCVASKWLARQTNCHVWIFNWFFTIVIYSLFFEIYLNHSNKNSSYPNFILICSKLIYPKLCLLASMLNYPNKYCIKCQFLSMKNGNITSNQLFANLQVFKVEHYYRWCI